MSEGLRPHTPYTPTQAELLDEAEKEIERLCGRVRDLAREREALAEERDHLHGAYGAGERGLHEIECNFEKCEMRHLPDAIWAVRIAKQALVEMRYYRDRADDAYRTGVLNPLHPKGIDGNG